MVLSAQIDFEWMKCSANRCDPLWSNARQVIEDLLFEVSEANDLRVWSKHFNALPRELPGVLGLVNDDDGMPSRERRKQMAASGEQTSGVGSEQVERDAALFAEQPLALNQPLIPFVVLVVDAPVQSLLILRQQNRQFARSTEQVRVRLEDVPEEGGRSEWKVVLARLL